MRAGYRFGYRIGERIGYAFGSWLAPKIPMRAALWYGKRKGWIA